PLTVQAKLLRFLQNQEYERVGDNITRKSDVRIISATNSDIKSAIKQGRFREDLYYRLNVIQIEIPPLRSRPDDIEKIAKELLFFFSQQNHKSISNFSDDALAGLRKHSWPGNIRELRNVIERAVILSTGDKISLCDLPSLIESNGLEIEVGKNVSLEELEEAHIRKVLISTNSLGDAAKILGIDLATLWRKRKKFGI
ncbi:MAG: sigma 54-interacting transcriptional regulator, partial [Acidobacteria bacterium]|nr:sigma 54-interacting transcriptional regulator [Acidobacteriota bacterium]